MDEDEELAQDKIVLFNEAGTIYVPYWHLRTWSDFEGALEILASGPYPDIAAQYTPERRPKLHAVVFERSSFLDEDILAAVTVEENYEDYMNFLDHMDSEFPGWDK